MNAALIIIMARKSTTRVTEPNDRLQPHPEANELVDRRDGVATHEPERVLHRSADDTLHTNGHSGGTRGVRRLVINAAIAALIVAGLIAGLIFTDPLIFWIAVIALVGYIILLLSPVLLARPAKLVQDERAGKRDRSRK